MALSTGMIMSHCLSPGLYNLTGELTFGEVEKKTILNVKTDCNHPFTCAINFIKHLDMYNIRYTITILYYQIVSTQTLL